MHVLRTHAQLAPVDSDATRTRRGMCLPMLVTQWPAALLFVLFVLVNGT